MEFKEKLKERRAYEESENAKAKSSTEVKVVEEAVSIEKHSEEVTDAKNQSETTDALEDGSDHSQMNGEQESRVQNGDPATAPDEDGKSSIDSLESQTESREVSAATSTEPAAVNGECKAVDEVTLVEKETPKDWNLYNFRDCRQTKITNFVREGTDETHRQ